MRAGWLVGVDISLNAVSSAEMYVELPAAPQLFCPAAAITAIGSSLLTDDGKFLWKLSQALTSFSSKPGPASAFQNVVLQPEKENSATLNPRALPAMSSAGIQFPTKESPKITTTRLADDDPYQQGTGLLASLFSKYGSQDL